MTEQEPGFRVTIRDVYTDLQELKAIVAERLPEDVQSRLRKVENQVSAQWVVVGIVISVLGALTVRAFAGA